MKKPENVAARLQIVSDWILDCIFDVYEISNRLRWAPLDEPLGNVMPQLRRAAAAMNHSPWNDEIALAFTAARIQLCAARQQKLDVFVDGMHGTSHHGTLVLLIDQFSRTAQRVLDDLSGKFPDQYARCGLRDPRLHYASIEMEAAFELAQAVAATKALTNGTVTRNEGDEEVALKLLRRRRCFEMWNNGCAETSWEMVMKEANAEFAGQLEPWESDSSARNAAGKYAKGISKNLRRGKPGSKKRLNAE